MAGSATRDETTCEADARKQDYRNFLDVDGLKGARIGVVRAIFGGRNDLAAAVVEEALKVLQAKGAILIDPVEVPNTIRCCAPKKSWVVSLALPDLGSAVGN